MSNTLHYIRSLMVQDSKAQISTSRAPLSFNDNKAIIIIVVMIIVIVIVMIITIIVVIPFNPRIQSMKDSFNLIIETLVVQIIVIVIMIVIVAMIIIVAVIIIVVVIVVILLTDEIETPDPS